MQKQGPKKTFPSLFPQATPKPVGNWTVFRLLGTNFGLPFFALGPLPRPARPQTPKGLRPSWAREGAGKEG